MYRVVRVAVACGIASALLAALQAQEAPPAAPEVPPRVDFARDVAPILRQRCLRCHHAADAESGLSLASADGLRDGGYVVPGQPDRSPLLALVVPGADGQRPAMPKQGPPLSPAELAVLRQWVAQGAAWPDGLTLQPARRADGSWWSLQALAEVAPPEPPGLPADWAAHPIDRFVFARLREAGLRPNPPADRRDLIRRLSYDLIGLPPSIEEVEAFAHDPAPDAYERLVDRLLASPQYGEQWGRHWLDVVRFGESNGYERNILIPNLWPFRDYVIGALNDDRPFDQLIVEHLAGDIAAAGDPSREIGTAFLVCGPYDNVGNRDPVQAAIIRANHIDEMLRVTTEAFLGLTVGCARCHDHKFDPITQRDYYALYATLAGVRHGERVVATDAQRRDHEARLQPLRAKEQELSRQRDALRRSVAQRGAQAQPTADEQRQLDALQRQLDQVQQAIKQLPPLPRVWAGTFDAQAAQQPHHVFRGGDPQKPGEAVAPASLQVLDHLASRYQLDASAGEAERRLALARWLASPDNPLVPRVLANRLWHYHFGTGLVDTPSDFGAMGSLPTHPELLDWLARQVLRHGWRLKPLHRLIVTSQTYRQSSTWRAEAADIDGDTRLLWRFPPRRLTAEEVRDTMLALAGALRLSPMGGPGFRLYQYQQDNVATYVPLDVHGPETYRRAVYHQNARAARVDVLSDFDCPDPAAAAPRRASTTTPLQALAMLNHRFVHDMARAMAQRIQHEAGSDPARQVHQAFRLAYARSPDDEEAPRCARLVQQHGLWALCLALLNSNELMYLR
jgi:hypothetical protein